MGLLVVLMRKLAVLLVASLFFYGCDFDVPIEETPRVRISPVLLGTWVSQSEDEKVYLSVLRKDDFSYQGETWPEGERAKAEKFVAFASSVGGASFFSIDLGSQETKRYAYARVVVVDKRTFTFEPVRGESAFAFDTTGSVLERLVRHQNDKDLLGELQRFIRE